MTNSLYIEACLYNWADGQTDGRTDGRTDGQTDGRTDGRTDGEFEEVSARAVRCPSPLFQRHNAAAISRLCRLPWYLQLHEIIVFMNSYMNLMKPVRDDWQLKTLSLQQDVSCSRPERQGTGFSVHLYKPVSTKSLIPTCLSSSWHSQTMYLIGPRPGCGPTCQCHVRFSSCHMQVREAARSEPLRFVSRLQPEGYSKDRCVTARSARGCARNGFASWLCPLAGCPSSVRARTMSQKCQVSQAAFANMIQVSHDFASFRANYCFASFRKLSQAFPN